MNERIKEFIRASGLDNDTFPIDQYDNPELEKFAELIIRECIEQFAHSVTDNTEIIQDRFVQCRKVAEHFGIKR